MASPKVETPKTGADCCAPAPGRTKERTGWLMAIPLIGVVFCCGGPLIGAWLASAGLLTIVGSWWAGSGRWVVLGVAVGVFVGLSGWIARRAAKG